jgi:hypothetical protein
MPKIHGEHEDKHFFPLIAGQDPRVTARNAQPVTFEQLYRPPDPST